MTHLFKLPLGYFDRRPVGEISTRLAELGKIRGFLTGTALTLVLDVIFGTVYFFVLISYSGLLTAVALCVIPLYLAMVYIVAPVIKRQLRIAAEANAAATSLMLSLLLVSKPSRHNMLKPRSVGVGSSVMQDLSLPISAQH